MSRLEDTKARLERVLGRFEAIALRMQALQTDNQSLQVELHKSQERESLLRLAAYDALTEIDQAIAIIAKQTSTENEPIDDKAPLESQRSPVFDQETEESVFVGSVPEEEDLSAISIAQSLQPESEPGADFTADIKSTDNDDRDDTNIDTVEHEVEHQTANSHNNIENNAEEKPTDQNKDSTKNMSGGSWSYLDD